VFLPTPAAKAFCVGAEAEGRIVDFSDSGPTPRAFAMIELDDGQTVVVAVEKLKLAWP